LTGGIAFTVLTVRVTPEQVGNVPLLYGVEESAPIGVFIHLVHSIAVGIIYAWGAGFDTLHDFATRVVPGVILGLAFGIFLWLVAASVLMPFWLGVVTSRSPSVPDFDLVYFVGHVVYGVILGGGYPLLLTRMPDAHGRRHRP
jgi:hypothetical protein